MKSLTFLRLCALLAASVSPLASARGRGLVVGDPDQTGPGNAPVNAQPEHDWQFQIGAGFLYGPAFLGSEDYQLRAGPHIEVRFKDRFFISMIDGAGFDLVKTDCFRAGPLVMYQQDRKQNGDNLFVIAGDRTDALQGLGDVAATAELGGHLQYRLGAISAKAEVRQGLGGHDGLIADLGARYTARLKGIRVGNRSVIVSVGSHATIVDDKYNQSYFGIDTRQSMRSGLSQFNAKGGLQSYGVDCAIVIPVTRSLSAAVRAGFDRLSGDAGESPLVLERGSRNQGTIGFGLTYRFGL